MGPFLDSAIRLDNSFFRVFYNGIDPFIFYACSVRPVSCSVKIRCGFHAATPINTFALILLTGSLGSIYTNVRKCDKKAGNIR
jgi:hypothetical protein